MTYETLMYVHLFTVLPAALIGLLIFSIPKGTRFHKVLGRVYVPLMFITALVTLFMPARVGFAWLGHFGFIHLFSALVLYSIPIAVVYARKGNITGHRNAMIGVYLGGILIAGSLTLTPGRFLYDVLF